MAAPARQSSPKKTHRRTRWLVSPRYDLSFFVASAALAFVFAPVYHWLTASHAGQNLGVDANLLTYFVFTALFDHPHIFQSFSRSHLDAAELERHRGLHTWGLAAFIVAGYVILASGLQHWMIVFAAFYGTWHVMRQHWGFLRLYKALNHDWDRWDTRLETALYYLGMVAIVLVGYSDISRPVVIYREFSAPFFATPGWLGWPAFYGFIALTLIYAGRQVQHLVRGQPVNLPKLLVMTCALGTHGYVHMVGALPFLVTEAVETAYHDVQYQGFIGHYQRRRHGRRFARRFLALALLYGLLVGLLECGALLRPQLTWVMEPFAMVVIYHYYADGKLWRTRDAPELRQALLERPPV